MSGSGRPATPSGAGGPGWLFWPFLASILAAPILLGANRPLGWSLLALATGVLLLAWAAIARRRDAAPVPLTRLAPAALPLALAVGWAFLQSLPLSGLSDAVWSEAGAALERSLQARISLAPEEAATGIMRLITYGGVLLLAVQFGHSARRESAVLWAVALAGAAYALYGLLVFADGNHMLLGMEKWAYPSSLTSTFVSRNSYATYAGLGLCASFGLLARGLAGERREAANEAALLCVLALLITAALLLTHSRAGIASATLGVVVMAGLVATGEGTRRARLVFASCALGLLAAATAVLGSGVVGRKSPERLEEWSGRTGIWERTVAAILDRPLGGGLGAFVDFFPAYRDFALGLQKGSIDKAHNLYLEMAAELGLPVAAALIFGMGWLALRAAGPKPGAPLAAAGATVLVAAHSLADFSLQIPAVTATWLLLLGTALGRTEQRRSNTARAVRRGSGNRDPGALQEFPQPAAAATDR
ncbi:MAG TPA: O-antigen ligase family protein [Methylomirabilota bacterium]|nr:O-antigen ligase family protein [Methylomirabilota bacterium]